MGNKTKIAVGLLFFFLSYLCGCDKGQPFDTTGEIVSETRNVGVVKRLDMFDDVNVILTDKIERGTVVVSAGENIIGKIETSYNEADSVLTVKNSNKWNWVRDMNPEINVWVYYKDMEWLSYDAVSYLTADSTLIFSWFVLTVQGNGVIALDLDCESFGVSMWASYSDVILSGESRFTNFYNDGVGVADLRYLKSNKMNIRRNSVQDCYVWVQDSIVRATIEHGGNVYYRGDPGIGEVIRNGSGNLIKMTD